jgi:hypothetical protein
MFSGGGGGGSQSQMIGMGESILEFPSNLEYGARTVS